METILQNQFLSVAISSLGAEVLSIYRKDLDCQYLWHGDTQYWGSHAPLLFPMVCAAMNGQIKIDGHEYPIGNHGFAKISEFDLIEATDASAVFRLVFNEKTLTSYPYQFALTVNCRLSGNQLVTDYLVENLDDQTIYFQIGTHAGFLCPLDAQTVFEDYYLEFEQPETLNRQFMNAANCRIPNKIQPLGKDVRKLPLTHSLFAEGGLVFSQFNSRQVTLKSDRSERSVAVSYQNLPQIAFWQPKNEAPFVCIEPWHGLADVDGYTGEFKDREGVVGLPKGQCFNCQLVIETR